jgi:predicted nucleic acid-binding protein
VEIFKYKQKIQDTSQLEEYLLLTQLENVISCINFIREDLIPVDLYQKALKLCKSTDEKDTPFVALTLFLEATLLTGDKRLSKQLKNTDCKVISIYDLHQLI